MRFAKQIMNGGVQESFVNEKRIELEIRSLAATIMRFAKQTDQWLAASRSINTAIKVPKSTSLFSILVHFCSFSFG